jgi:two-component system, NtrC family, nitrogen regulation sensor histidine kinase NtrY
MQIGLSRLPFSRFRRLSAWSGLAVVSLAIVMGLVTFSVLTGVAPVEPSRDTLRLLLLSNAALVALMAAMVLWQIWQLLAARRHGEAGASLHVRLVSLFSVIAALPALVVAVFATVTLSRGLDTWLSERTRDIVEQSVLVAETYLKDHSQNMRGDVAAISADLNAQRALFDSDRQAFLQRAARQAVLRGLSGLFVFDPSQNRLEVSVTANNKI